MAGYRNRVDGAVEMRPQDSTISALWKDALYGIKSLGWIVKNRRKGEAVYTTDKGRVGTLLLKEFDEGIWRLSVDFVEIAGVEPEPPAGEKWQGEFTCMAVELWNVCERLPKWLAAYDRGQRVALLEGMDPWMGSVWTESAQQDYEDRCSDAGLLRKIEGWDRMQRGVVNAHGIAKELGLDRNRTVFRVSEVMKHKKGWERVKPEHWRRVFSDEWILQILKELGHDGMCDTPGVLVRTWHGYDKKEHEKLETYMQDMRKRGLIRLEGGLWWRVVGGKK